MDLGIKGKVVLCMASAAGLGKGIAMEMAREGAKVMICTAEPFKDQLFAAQAEIEKETGNRPETFLCDVNKAEDIEALVKRLGGGRILNSTSSSVKDCLDNLILSNTMRMGVVGMSKTLAREVGKDNILVNVFGPGRIGTARIESLNKMRADKAGISVAEYEKQDLKEFPMGRYGTTDEYGRLAAWLCSEANTYVSGQTILLDGAMTRAY